MTQVRFRPRWALFAALCALVLLARPVAAAEEVRTVVPTVAPASRALSEVGLVKAASSVDLVARVSGTLEQIAYRDGEPVEQGALLFVIEPAPYRAALKQAEAAVTKAQATLDNAQASLERDLKLNSNSIAKAQIDAVRTQRDEARAQLASAEAQRDAAEINLGYTEIRAPFDGYVSAHLADVGALVGQGGVTTLATIVQLDPAEVTFAIPDTDMLRLRDVGKARGLTRKDLSDIVVEARTREGEEPVIGSIDYVAPLTNAATGTLSVRAVFPNPDRVLLPGLFVRLRIPYETVADALYLPDAAIGSDQGGSYVLAVGSDGLVQRVDVTLGVRGEAGQEVKGPLGPTDRVVANVMSGVRPGDIINAVE